jgi:hypothetical protein
MPGVTQVWYDAFNRPMTYNRNGSYTNLLYCANWLKRKNSTQSPIFSAGSIRSAGASQGSALRFDR